MVDQQSDRICCSLSSTDGSIVTLRQTPQSVMVHTVVTDTNDTSLFLSVPLGTKLKSYFHITRISNEYLPHLPNRHF